MPRILYFLFILIAIEDTYAWNKSLRLERLVSDSRYAVGFYGLLRTYVIDAVQKNIHDTLLSPNQEDGGVDVFWHIYADDRERDQRRALNNIRSQPWTAGLVVEPWRFHHGESSSHQERSPASPNPSSVTRDNSLWAKLPLPSWLLAEFRRDHPIILNGSSYGGSIGYNEAGILSHWRKKKLLCDLITTASSKKKTEYSVVVVSRSDVIYGVARGQPLPIHFRHFEIARNESVLVVPEKGDYLNGLHDMFVAGSVYAIEKYAKLYDMLPSMQTEKALPTIRGEHLRHSKKRRRVVIFHSESLLQVHLRRERLKIARTPLLMTVVRTSSYMKNVKADSVRYDAFKVAEVLAKRGFPDACSTVWSFVGGPRARCPHCCTIIETDNAVNVAKSGSFDVAVCWGISSSDYLENQFSYTGVEVESNSTCSCKRRVVCDLCTPIESVFNYRCSPFRDIHCIHSDFNHKKHPDKKSCPLERQ